MIVANTGLENVESPVQVLKALREVAALVVVDRQGGIARTNLRVINSQKSLLQHDCFRL